MRRASGPRDPQERSDRISAGKPAVAPPRSYKPSSLLAAGAIAVLTISGIEASVAATALRADPKEGLLLMALASRSVLSYLLAPVGFIVWAVLLTVLKAGGPWNNVRVGLLALGSLGLVAEMYDTLTEYEKFAGYPPFVAAFAGQWLGLVVFAIFWDRAWDRRVAWHWMALMGAGLLASAGGLHYANYRFEVGRYPTLHL